MDENPPSREQPSEAKIEAAFKSLVVTLRTPQNNFRYIGPSSEPNGSKVWQFAAELPTGSTISSHVWFYPSTGEFKGFCMGKFTCSNILDVIERLRKKFETPDKK